MQNSSTQSSWGFINREYSRYFLDRTLLLSAIILTQNILVSGAANTFRSITWGEKISFISENDSHAQLNH